MSRVMRCKFQLHEVAKFPLKSTQRTDGSYEGTEYGYKISMGAVWHSSEEAQAKSENAIFGRLSPQGEFKATIHNPHVGEALSAMVGKQFYIDFTPAPDGV